MERSKLVLHIHRLYSILSRGKLGKPLDVDRRDRDQRSFLPPVADKRLRDSGANPDASSLPSGFAEGVPISAISIDERAVLAGLSHCQFKTGSADRQFCRKMWDAAEGADDFSMTEGQHAYLWRLAYRYRHQLSAEVNAIMETRLEQLRHARLAPDEAPASSGAGCHVINGVSLEPATRDNST